MAPSMTVTAVDGGFAGGGFKNSFGNLWMRQAWELTHAHNSGAGIHRHFQGG